MKQILGISRSPQFSPNHIGNDGKIFNLTVAELEKKGHNVRRMNEDEFCATENAYEDVIFSMSRHLESVEKLKQLEKKGAKIINSGQGIENCFRANMTTLLLNNNVPYPKSYILSTDDDCREVFEKLGSKNVWIKRGDFHTVHREDIAFCRHHEEGDEILKEYAARGIPNAVLSEHLWGDLVKFYAVRNTPFFYWFYPLDANHLMMGAQNTEQTKYFEFEESELRKLTEKSAEVLDIHIYGGDAIISKDNKIHLIDVNDWPSFAPCRDAACEHIAQAIELGIKN